MTVNELPVGWVKCTIKDIGNVVSGGTPSTKDDAYFNGDIAWITPADLSKYNNKFIISALVIIRTSAEIFFFY